MSANKVLRTGWILVLLVLLAVPAGAAGRVIHNGIDTWHTPDDGRSFMDFAKDPIPADFLCSGSEAFMGRIHWMGKAIKTSPEGVLGEADTIILRMDDAHFGSDGVAVTRLQVAALSLVGRAPVETSCGAFRVRAALAPGGQPITEMHIVRTREDGGYFVAPLTLNARLTFTPVGGKRSERLELDHVIRFAPPADAQWSDVPRNARLQLKGFVGVDTTGNGRVDTSLPGTSNFFPTFELGDRGALTQKQETVSLAELCAGMGCHAADGDCHCPTPPASQ